MTTSATGVIFVREDSGIRIRASRRIDLSVSRMGQQAARKADLDQAKRLAAKRGERLDRIFELDVLGAVETPSFAGAQKLRRVLLTVFADPGSGDLVAVDKVSDVLARCRKTKGLVVYSPEPPAQRRVIFNTPVTTKRWVPDPMMSRAEKLEQLDRFPNSRWIGWAKADVNLSTRIGGLARVRGKTEAQIEGAAKFRAVAERAMIGGARAIDYEQVRVDSSGLAANREIEDTEHARRLYQSAVTRLGGAGCRLHVVAEKVIVMDMTIAQAAESMIGNCGGAARERVTSEILLAATILAEEFGFATSPT